SANLPDGYMETIQALWLRGTRIAGFDAIRTGQAIVAHDLPALTNGVDLLEPYREFTDREWATLVALPLTYRGESVGSLNVCFSRERLPDDDDMAVLRTLADQAAVTAANLQLFTESQQRRRRAETLAMVASALTGGRSIEDTLESLSQVVVETTSAVASSVTLSDDERGNFTLAGTYGLPPGFTTAVHNAWREGRTTLISQTLAGSEVRLTRRGKQRMLEDPDYAEAWEIVRDEPWEAIALIPMVYRNRTVGMLAAFYLPDDTPSEDDLSLLSAVAGQAAVAVENRRLFVETERRLRQLEAVAAIASNLTFDQPLDEMMRSLADNVLQSTTAIACSVTRVDERLALPMRIMAIVGLPDGYREALQGAYDAGAPSVAMTAYRDREAMIIHNSRGVTMSDPRYDAAARLVADEPWDCVGVIPIIFRDEALGLLVAYYPVRQEPTNEEMAYLSAIADQAAIAIKNAALIEQGQESAAVGERQRLARELHDSVSQALYGIALGAQTARTLLDRDATRAKEPVEYVLQLAQAGLAEMRALIFELRPESLAQEGIVAAMEKQVAATNVRYGLSVEADLGTEPAVPLDAKEAAYRIGQEALHNIVKHAKAAHVWITLRFEDDVLWLKVQDDGVGFDPDGEYPGHLGLRSMRERAIRVRGTLDFTSAIGHGTAITLRIPVPEGSETHLPASMGGA
ncbi:MAG: GAF domain-containing sensor histidine kinase, partial [Dehalococcoidia bacterium]